MTDDIKREFQSFEDTKHFDEDGVEYWSARELLPLSGYGSYEAFERIIARAKQSVESSGMDINIVFRQATKYYKSNNRFSEFEAAKPDYHITRYGCYIVAQNGDPKIPEIAAAQAYFAVQTLRQEEYDKLSDDRKRLYVRKEVLDKNKKLTEVAYHHGVRHYGTFHDAGYQGLYGMRYKEIVKQKSLGNDKLLDRAGTTELAANLFRVTQTEEQLSKHLGSGRRIGERSATVLHNRVGKQVRQAIKEIGGTMPEHLAPEPNIKQLEDRSKRKKLLSGK